MNDNRVVTVEPMEPKITASVFAKAIVYSQASGYFKVPLGSFLFLPLNKELFPIQKAQYREGKSRE